VRSGPAGAFHRPQPDAGDARAGIPRNDRPGADRRWLRFPRAQGLYLRGHGLFGGSGDPQHGQAQPAQALAAGSRRGCMTDFRRLTDNVLASPQITEADIGAAQALGVTTIVNNRPEGESDDQTPGAQIRAAAEQAGMAYHAIPITHAGFSEAQVKAMADVL